MAGKGVYDVTELKDTSKYESVDWDDAANKVVSDMDPLDKARLERIEAAVKDRDLNGYTEVKPEDVAALAALVSNKSETVQVLAKAAANNLPQAEGVHFRTEHLAHLVEQAKVKAPEPKEKE